VQDRLALPAFVAAIVVEKSFSGGSGTHNRLDGRRTHVDPNHESVRNRVRRSMRGRCLPAWNLRFGNLSGQSLLHIAVYALESMQRFLEQPADHARVVITESKNVIERGEAVRLAFILHDP